MPHRVNKKGDIGTAKSQSDSYDAHNIYLTEEGWVYRHYKTADKSMWWDEIIVAGQVKPPMVIHGKGNGPMVETNPAKLGVASPTQFEDGGGNSDFRYSDHQNGDSIRAKKVVKLEDKVYADGDSYRVQDAIKNTPAGWSGPSDPSDPSVPGEKPPFVGDDHQACNEYNVTVSPLPAPGRDTDPRSVVAGEPDGTCGPTITQTAVTVTSTGGNALGSVLTAAGGDGEGAEGAALTATYAWTGAKEGTGDEITADVAGSYTVTATVTEGDATKTTTASWNIEASVAGVFPTARFAQMSDANAPGKGQTFTVTIDLDTSASNAIDTYTYSVEAKATEAEYYINAAEPTFTRPTVTPTATGLVYTGDSPDVYGSITAVYEIVATYGEFTKVIAAPVLKTQAFDNCSITPIVTDFDGGSGASSSNVAKIEVAYNCGLDNPAFSEISAPGADTQAIIDDGDGGLTITYTNGSLDGGVVSSYTGPVQYVFSGTYYSGDLTNLVTFNDPSTLGNKVTLDIDNLTSFEAPQAVNGYYPLYTSEANSNSAGDGSSHTHTFDGTTYYMPNGVTFYHGNYGNTGGGSGY